jgi:UDP:flavonoid glycosyltransferase YjiC (YdhE family)
MRALFVVFPAPSHFFPLVPLAWATRAAGHEVRVACPPSFVSHVLGSGLPAVPVGVDVDRAGALDSVPADAPPGARPLAMFGAVADAMTPDLLAFASHWRPDVVVHEPRAYAAVAVAERLRLPLVRHLWGTDYTYLRRDAEAPLLAPLLDRLGAAGADLTGALTIDPCPPSLQVAAAPRRALMRYVPYNGPGVDPAWLREPPGRPRVCVTGGTTFTTTAGRPHPMVFALAALADLDCDVVVTVPAAQRKLLPDPVRARVVDAMPLHLLLPGCAAVVHSGGAGTTITSLLSGVPQLIVPTVADGQMNAERVTAAGVGRWLPRDGLTVERVRDEAAHLLRDDQTRLRVFRARAHAVPQPAPAALVAALTAAAKG